MDSINFDDITQKVKDVASDLGKRAEDQIDVGKIKSQIHNLQKENDRDYMEIGKMIYEKYESEEQIDGDLTDLCGAIHQRDEEIDAQQSEIDKIKGV